jgi:hypothetical protein
MKSRSWGYFAGTVTLISVLLLIAPAVQATRTSASIKHGGAVTVTETGVTWPSLDPATNAIAALNANLMNAVYGQLFE